MEHQEDDMKMLSARIEEWLSERGGCLVAFSGGVDSTLLVYLAKGALGDGAAAVTVTGPLQHRFEIEEARLAARRAGIRHILYEFSPLTIQEVRTNDPDRCYFCKKAIFSILIDAARSLGLDTVIDGTNADDMSDYRPGMRALGELGIRSPFLELGVDKDQIRRLSHFRGIPGFDRPPMACLASRFPYGEALTSEKIRRVREAEALLRRLGFRVCRVRSLAETAKIEVGTDELARFSSRSFRGSVERGIKGCGFSSVVIDPLGYRTGSMNEILSLRET